METALEQSWSMLVGEDEAREGSGRGVLKLTEVSLPPQLC